MTPIERDVLWIAFCAGAVCFGLGMLAGMFLTRRVLKQVIADLEQLAGRPGERR